MLFPLNVVTRTELGNLGSHVSTLPVSAKIKSDEDLYHERKCRL